MTILVTGANGQLGREMRVVSKDSTHRYIFTDVTDIPDALTIGLDVTDAAAVISFVKENKVDVIVNCAAYTNVDKAETDVQACTVLNVKAPENLALAMKETGGFLVHISTDYVFDGEGADGPYSEDMPCSPSNVYGRTKLEGESAVAASGCRYIIIRTSWLYSEYGRNFVKTMLGLTATRPQLNVVSDQTGTPTYALDLAETIRHIVESGKSEGNEGIYHYSNEGICTWYDFAKAIAGYSGNAGCDIRPCTSDEYPSPVRRPAYSVLDKTKIKKVFGIEVPFWTDSLEECLKNITRI